MNDRLPAVLADLAAESAQLDGWVASLAPAAWATPTPAAGWTVAHQIGHLTWTDEVSLAAATDPTGFAASVQAALADPTGFVDAAATELAGLAPADLLARWRAARSALAAVLRALPADRRLPWYGPTMSATSMATARLMETWAHAHDVAEALGRRVPRTDRARHVAHLGVRTRDFAHHLRGETPPAEPFRVELTAPSGDRWAWGPADAAQRVTGDGWDFALVATRRLHPDDAALSAVGAAARHWLGIVQAFAGLPGADPVRRADRARADRARADRARADA